MSREAEHEVSIQEFFRISFSTAAIFECNRKASRCCSGNLAHNLSTWVNQHTRRGKTDAVYFDLTRHDTPDANQGLSGMALQLAIVLRNTHAVNVGLQKYEGNFASTIG